MPSQKHAPHPQSEPEIPTQQEAPQRTRRCRHIFAAGRQCGSPCLRTEHFCYFHHTTRRPVSDPKARSARCGVYHLPTPEDRDSIRAAIAQVMDAIAHNNIDPRRAGLLLYSLQIALCALPKEPRMPIQSVDISAAARPVTSRKSHRKPKPVSSIPAEPVIEETVLDEDYGLIAPETFLEPEEVQQDTGEWQDPGDNVLQDGRLLRNTLGYKLLKDVELYESRTQGWYRGRVDALAEAAKAAKAAAAERGATAVQLAETLASAAAKAVVAEADFTAQVAAGMAKSRFYTGKDPDDVDAEDAPTPELEPWESPILPSLNASADPVHFVSHSRKPVGRSTAFVCHSRRESASPTHSAGCPIFGAASSRLRGHSRHARTAVLHHP